MDVIERSCHQRPRQHSRLIVYLLDLGSSSSYIIFGLKWVRDLGLAREILIR